MATKATTWQVLRNKFPSEEYVLIAEVPDHVGQRNRYLDFMVINLWASRGYSIIGIERKSNRGDWLKEMKTPAKQETHFRHCNYFYLLTDNENVAKLEEIPDTWGWYHINPNGTLKVMKTAPKLTPIPIPVALMCGMLRRADDKRDYVHKDQMQQFIDDKAEQIRENRNYTLEREAQNYRDLKPIVDEFEKITGVSINGYDDIKDIGEAVRQIRSGGLNNFIKRFFRISEEVKQMHERMILSHEKMNEYLTKQIEKIDEA